MSSCRVMQEDPLLRTGLWQTETQNHSYHGIDDGQNGSHCLTVHPGSFLRLNLARAGESDSACFRTLCVRDDASEPTRTYSWRVLKGALSLSPADSNK